MAPRGVAAFFGGSTLLNLAGSFVRRRFDCNLWWIDLRGLPDALSAALLLGVGLSLAACAVRWPCRGSWRWAATAACTAFAVLASAVHAAQFFVLLATDRIRSSFPVPVSALVCAALGWVLFRLVRPAPKLRPPELRRWR